VPGIMTVMVTGAGGFVGRALCNHLAQHGHEIRRAVRRVDATSGPDVARTVAIGDLGPSTNWTAALRGVDAVVHLAARVHLLEERGAAALPEYRRVNVEGTRSLAVAARRTGVRRLVFVSSAKVHGERSARPFTELDPPHPEDDYARSKLEAEEAIKATLAGGPTQWAILRPPLVYGPAVRANFLKLMRAVTRGVPLPLAAIDNRRSLVYVGNLVDAIRACLAQEGAGGKTWLVSDGEDLSTPELVRRLGRALNRPARLVPVPVPLLRLAGALSGKAAAVGRLVESLQVDATAIRVALPWTPPYSVDQGLLETARWFRTVPAA
jgi:nucleoside-diphosphate-sugar epimerase